MGSGSVVEATGFNGCTGCLSRIDFDEILDNPIDLGSGQVVSRHIPVSL
jgi:hypothetical protein